MKAPNHIIGGIIFTGTFGAIIGFNILSNPWYIAFNILASLFPDIDHTRSTIGKCFYPLAKFIDRRFGHRTITHSLIMLFSTTLIVQLIQSAFIGDSNFTAIWLLAFSSHLIFDMMTVQGVPLFYPFYQNACVLPGNPSQRMRSNDLVSEAKVMAFFVVCFLLLKPLMANGFWTSYNRLFGTMKHLVSEYTKSEDLLLAEYTYKIASDTYTGSGFVAKCSENQVALIQNNQWKILDRSAMVIQEVIPSHTGLGFEFIYNNFLSIDTDSLNSILSNQLVIDYEFQATRPFVLHTSTASKIQERVVGEYAADMYAQLQPTDTIEPVDILYTKSPRIKTIHRKIDLLKVKYQRDLDTYESAIMEVARLRDDYESTNDLYEQESILAQIKTLQKLKAPLYPDLRIKELQDQVDELVAKDRQTYTQRLRDNMIKAKGDQVGELRFTGYIRYFQIKDNDVIDPEI